MTDIEENSEDSDATIDELMKEEEEEIGYPLCELALESNRESANAAEEHKKEREDPQDLEKEKEKDDRGINVEDRMPYTTRMEELKDVLHELYNLKKVFLKNKLKPWNRSNLAEFEDPKMKEREKKMKEGRLLIKDVSNNDEKKKCEEESSSSRKGKEKIYEPEQIYDPLKLIRDIIYGFCDYIENINEMAKQRVKVEMDWSAHFENGVEVMKKLTEKLRQLNEEMQRMKKRKDERENYVKIHEMLSKMEEINAVLDSSPKIEIVSERDCTELELKICQSELRLCKNQLRDLLWGVVRLKQQRDKISQV